MKKLKRYYFWQYLTHKKEWRQLGRGNGYSSIKECKEDNEFYMLEPDYEYIILEANPYER